MLVTPALAQSPIRALAWSQRGWLANVLANARYAPFAAPWNLAGWPAMAVPAGVGRDGLPLSVQLVARPGGEALLLALAGQLERCARGSAPRRASARRVAQVERRDLVDDGRVDDVAVGRPVARPPLATVRRVCSRTSASTSLPASSRRRSAASGRRRRAG